MWRVRLNLLARSLRSNWALFAQDRLGLVGLSVIVLYGLFALAHPILMNTVWDPVVYHPVSGFDMQIAYHPSAPSPGHLLGTDPLGRDILSQLMYSTRFEFILGILAALVTIGIATTLGAIAAFYGGIIDILIMRVVNLVMMIPILPILIVLAAMMSVGMIELAVVIGILTGLGGSAIVIKSQALTVKVRPYIEAARIAGGSNRHIIFRHMVPNLLPVALLFMMFTVNGAILNEAILSFFGLTEIEMSWGIMINTTQFFGYLLRFDTWWLLFPASMAISTLCAGFYIVGRALDEVVNPRLRQR
jgi:peptide/nickel transport system permease protein